MGIKQFITKIFIFVIIPLLALFIIIEALLRNIPNEYTYKNEWLGNNSGQLNMLILGASHGYFGINPEHLKKTSFNASHPSQSLKYDDFIFNKFLPKMNRLEYVVLPISIGTLFAKLEDDVEYFRIKKYVLYYHCNYHPYEFKYNFEFDDLRLGTAVKRISGYYINGRNEIYCNTLGFGTNYLLEKRSVNWEATGKVAALRHSVQINSPKLQAIYNENLGYLNSIVTKCQEKNIKVILLTTPTWHTYYENLNQKQLEIMINTCNGITNKYNHVTYLNLLQDPSFIESDFYDADHLSEAGAQKLTNYLMKVSDFIKQ